MGVYWGGLALKTKSTCSERAAPRWLISERGSAEKSSFRSRARSRDHVRNLASYGLAFELYKHAGETIEKVVGGLFLAFGGIHFYLRQLRQSG